MKSALIPCEVQNRIFYILLVLEAIHAITSCAAALNSRSASLRGVAGTSTHSCDCGIQHSLALSTFLKGRTQSSAVLWAASLHMGFTAVSESACRTHGHLLRLQPGRLLHPQRSVSVFRTPNRGKALCAGTPALLPAEMQVAQSRASKGFGGPLSYEQHDFTGGRRCTAPRAGLQIDWSDPDTLTGLLGGLLGLAVGIGAPLFYISRDRADEKKLEELRELNRQTFKETGQYLTEVRSCLVHTHLISLKAFSFTQLITNGSFPHLEIAYCSLLSWCSCTGRVESSCSIHLTILYESLDH